MNVRMFFDGYSKNIATVGVGTQPEIPNVSAGAVFRGMMIVQNGNVDEKNGLLYKNKLAIAAEEI
jgi:hypothetical protein